LQPSLHSSCFVRRAAQRASSGGAICTGPIRVTFRSAQGFAVQAHPDGRGLGDRRRSKHRPQDHRGRQERRPQRAKAVLPASPAEAEVRRGRYAGRPRKPLDRAGRGARGRHLGLFTDHIAVEGVDLVEDGMDRKPDGEIEDDPSRRQRIASIQRWRMTTS